MVTGALTGIVLTLRVLYRLLENTAFRSMARKAISTSSYRQCSRVVNQRICTTNARARPWFLSRTLGGDGALGYDSGTGVITYTGPSLSEVRAHFSGGTGVTIMSGSAAIGQAVGTTDDVEFNQDSSSWGNATTQQQLYRQQEI